MTERKTKIDSEMGEDERLDLVEQLDRLYSTLQKEYDQATTTLMFSKFNSEQSSNYMHPNAFRVLPALVNLNTDIESSDSSSAIFRKTFNYEQKFTLDSGNEEGGDIDIGIDSYEEY